MGDHVMNSRWWGYALAAIGAALFSTKAIFIKLAYRDEVNATLLVAWRMIFSTPVFIAVGMISAYLDFKGLEFISAQLERLVLFTYPLFIMFLGSLFFAQKITRHGILACIVTYLGLAVVVGLDLPSGGVKTAIGTTLVLGCAITFALNQLYAKQLITILGSIPKRW
jgi:drug/metabolite transporter (DMT)-like permease